MLKFACAAALAALACCGPLSVSAVPPSTDAVLASLGTTPVSLSSSSAAPLTHFAFGSCNKQDNAQPMWEHLLARRPQLWIWLGDVVYADKSTLEFFRHPAPLSEMKQMYSKQFNQEGYTKFRESQTQIIGVYDDHDYGENDGDTRYVDKVDARELFLDFIEEPRGSERRNRDTGGVNENYSWGSVSTVEPTGDASGFSSRRTQIILLDSRYFQDASADDMLGSAQWKWFEDILNAPEPTGLFILGSGVQLRSTDKRIGEGWRQLPRSRARIFSLFQKRKHNKDAMVMFISGDVHLAETDVTYICSNVSSEASSSVQMTEVHPFYEFTSSGLTHSVSDHTGVDGSPILL